MGRILAIDYGKKRVGLAVTDPLKIIAGGLTTVEASQVLDFLDKLNRDTATSIAEINISDPNNVMVYMNHSVQLKMGALDSLQKKLEITESVNREVKQAKHPIDYVDARFDGSYSIKLKE